MTKEQVEKRKEKYIEERTDAIQNIREVVADAPWFLKWRYGDDVNLSVYYRVIVSLEKKDPTLFDSLFSALKYYLTDRLGEQFFEEEIGDEAVANFIRNDLKVQMVYKKQNLKNIDAPLD